jgi:homoserine acetyltransferase
MDLFDVAEHGGTVEAGLARVRAARSLVIGVETDFLFPLDQQEEIAAILRQHGRDVRFEALPSIQGHDSFLVDMDRFSPVIGDFLAGI